MSNYSKEEKQVIRDIYWHGKAIKQKVRVTWLRRIYCFFSGDSLEYKRIDPNSVIITNG